MSINMDPEEYLVNILENQELSADEQVSLADDENEVEAFIRDEFADTPYIDYAGSRVKGTMIEEGYDLDIVCYFPNEYEATVEEVYNDVFDKLNKKYYVEKKTSALRIISTKNQNNIINYHIDVVPGKFTEDQEDGQAYLNFESPEKKILKTNIKIQINHVVQSNLQDIIKLIKLWNIRNKIGIKTFVLELLVVEVLNDSDNDKTIDKKLLIFWGKLKEEIDDIDIQDPANPAGNNLSEIFTQKHKDALRKWSDHTLSSIKNGGWVSVFGEVTSGQKERNIILGDFSHRVKPCLKWPMDIKYSSLEIVTERYLIEKNGWNHPPKLPGFLNSDSIIVLPSGLGLKYRAVFPPELDYDEIYWQVVNTGNHAKDVTNGLRGKLFENCDEALIKRERTEYTGKHWVECFLIKSDICIARKRFFINVFNEGVEQDRFYYKKFKSRRRK